MVVEQPSHPGRGLSSISVFVVSPSTQSERSFPAGTPIADVKVSAMYYWMLVPRILRLPALSTFSSIASAQAKLELVTGIAASAQKLTLHQPTAATSYELTEGAFIAALDDANRTLADYGVKEGDVIKVRQQSRGLDEARTLSLQTHPGMRTGLTRYLDSGKVAVYIRGRPQREEIRAYRRRICRQAGYAQNCMHNPISENMSNDFVFVNRHRYGLQSSQ